MEKRKRTPNVVPFEKKEFTPATKACLIVALMLCLPALAPIILVFLIVRFLLKDK